MAPISAQGSSPCSRPWSASWRAARPFGSSSTQRETSGVEIPAQIVEAWFCYEASHLLRIQPPKSKESEDYIRDLYSGVVDVGLNLDPVPQIPEDAGKGVTEGGVSQMADVGRLVRVDAGVFDDVDPWGGLGACSGKGVPDPHFPVQKDIDVPATGHFHPPDLGPLRERLREGLRDLPGGTPQVARQSERSGEREVPLIR